MTPKERAALRKLDNAFEHLRPRMTADYFTQSARNAEAEAGSLLAHAMCQVVHAAYARITYK